MTERLRRKVYEVTGLHEVFNDNNRTVVLKSSPEKTVPCLSPLAEKEGPLVKLNDTGRWRRRHALIVPQTFFYYYDEAATDLGPQGVIDLELYTNIQVVDGNVVRLAPGDENSPIRTFFLRLSDEDEAEAWAKAIRETRFHSVREERDALRSSKIAITEELAIHTEALRESKAALEASQRRENAAVSELARTNAREARRADQLRALLASARRATDRGSECSIGRVPVGAPAGYKVVEWIGAESEGMPKHSTVGTCALSELAALEEVIEERAREVASLKITNDALREEVDATTHLRRRDAAAALELLNQERQRVTKETMANGQLQAEVRALKLELEQNRADSLEARANVGVVAATCRKAEAKTRELQEHRRVLAREVKASRVEQRRLSAALACATTAASAAAATAAANATTSPSFRNVRRTRSPSAVSRRPGEGEKDVSAEVHRRGEGIEARGRDKVGFVEGGGDALCTAEKEERDCAGISKRPNGSANDNPFETIEGRDISGRMDDVSDPSRAGAMEARDGNNSNADSASALESSIFCGALEVCSVVCEDGAMTGDAAMSAWVRPASLDAFATSSSLGSEEERRSGTSGATSPEGISPAFCGRINCANDGERQPRSQPWDSSPLSKESQTYRRAEGSVSFREDFGCAKARARDDTERDGSERILTAKLVLRNGGGSENEHNDGYVHDGRGNDDTGGELRRSKSLGIGGGSVTRVRGATGEGDHILGLSRSSQPGPASPVAAAVSQSTATLQAPMAVVEESSRLNQMVQSFSAGLVRQSSRRRRRKPLLGSLDLDSDVGVKSDPPGEGEGEGDHDNDTAGSPDGTGGDSRRDSEQGQRDRGSWSAWSTVGSAGSYPGVVAKAEPPTSNNQWQDDPERDSLGTESVSFSVEVVDDACIEAAPSTAMSGSAAIESAGGCRDEIRQEEEDEKDCCESSRQPENSFTDELTSGVEDRREHDDSAAPLDTATGQTSINDDGLTTEVLPPPPPPPPPPQAVTISAPAAAAISTNKGLPHFLSSPPSSTPLSGWRRTLEAVADAAGETAAKATVANPAEWLRKVGRPDGEENANDTPVEEEADHRQQPCTLGGVPCSSNDGVAVTPTLGGVDSSAIALSAAAAAAAAAAERGGRASSEAAAAARRWEAKFKGSLISMTGGVRWGMGPPRLGGVANTNGEEGSKPA